MSRLPLFVTTLNIAYKCLRPPKLLYFVCLQYIVFSSNGRGDGEERLTIPSSNPTKSGSLAMSQFAHWVFIQFLQTEQDSVT